MILRLSLFILVFAVTKWTHYSQWRISAADPGDNVMVEVMDFLSDRLADSATGWSVGTFGAIAEFTRDADEAAELFRSEHAISAVTARGSAHRSSSRITPDRIRVPDVRKLDSSRGVLPAGKIVRHEWTMATDRGRSRSGSIARRGSGQRSV
jgi:hypothetical protein